MIRCSHTAARAASGVMASTAIRRHYGQPPPRCNSSTVGQASSSIDSAEQPGRGSRGERVGPFLRAGDIGVGRARRSRMLSDRSRAAAEQSGGQPHLSNGRGEQSSQTGWWPPPPAVSCSSTVPAAAATRTHGDVRYGAGAMRGCRRIPVRVVVDGLRLRSHTQVRRLTPALLVCESIVPEVGVELHSAYVCGDRQSRVEHLALAPGHAGAGRSARAPDLLLVPCEPRGCLLDHLLRFRELLEQSGHAVRIDLPSRWERLRRLVGRPDAVSSKELICARQPPGPG
jgi:hypothetical protein